MPDKPPDPDITRVLLVEDSHHNLVAARRCLAKATGFELAHCPSAEDALDLATDVLCDRDVIVVDHGLPGLNGLEFCRRLLQKPKCPPLVVLTGSGSERLAVDCLKLGVADYLVKDLNQDYLALLPLVLKNVVAQYRDRLARERAENALIEEGLRRKTLLDSLPVGVISLDADFNIREMNPEAEKITGYSAADSLGLPCEEVIVADCCGEGCPLRRSILTGDPVGPVDTTVFARNRNAIPLSYTASSLFNAAGDLVGGVLVFQDVTVLKALEQERATTLSVTIHDMKTPLVGIQGFSRQLLDKEPEITPEQRRSFLEIIHKEGRQLASLVDDYLTSARNGRSGLRLNLCQEDLTFLVRDLAESYGEKFRQQGQVLETDIPLTPRPLDMDPPRMRRALANLLDNASKYSPGGSRVRLRLVDDEYDYRLEVADQGPGIDPESMPHIFKPFFRAGGAQGKAGFGLGLAGVKAIVEGHGGSLGVRNRPQGGCVFFVQLPRQPEPAGG